MITVICSFPICANKTLQFLLASTLQPFTQPLVAAGMCQLDLKDV